LGRRLVETEWAIAPIFEVGFAASGIRDEQLGVLFSCCLPQLPGEMQVPLILYIRTASQELTLFFCSSPDAIVLPSQATTGSG
jgi:predicted RNA polymerase sigma factor